MTPCASRTVLANVHCAKEVLEGNIRCFHHTVVPDCHRDARKDKILAHLHVAALKAPNEHLGLQQSLPLRLHRRSCLSKTATSPSETPAMESPLHPQTPQNLIDAARPPQKETDTCVQDDPKVLFLFLQKGFTSSSCHKRCVRKVRLPFVARRMEQECRKSAPIFFQFTFCCASGRLCEMRPCFASNSEFVC